MKDILIIKVKQMFEKYEVIEILLVMYKYMIITNWLI